MDMASAERGRLRLCGELRDRRVMVRMRGAVAGWLDCRSTAGSQPSKFRLLLFSASVDTLPSF